MKTELSVWALGGHDQICNELHHKPRLYVIAQQVSLDPLRCILRLNITEFASSERLELRETALTTRPTHDYFQTEELKTGPSYFLYLNSPSQVSCIWAI
jgi:hypothetical protein